MEAREEIANLSRILRQCQHEYYVLARPAMSDEEYDGLFDSLKSLERQFPELILPDSPTARVGSDLSADLPEAAHSIPVLSLDKAYTVEGIGDWMRKSAKSADSPLSFTAEEKIDGVSIVLYYEEGLLVRALSRGNGYVGNDVTANVKTIKSVPLRLTEPQTLTVRGEIYLAENDFNSINKTMETPYANPRNLAAGVLRRIKSREVAAIPLNIFVYDGYFPEPPATNALSMEKLESLGFRLNPRLGYFAEDSSVAKLRTSHPSWFCGGYDDIRDFIRGEGEGRTELPYAIDGLVFKVNEMSLRNVLGFTGHHPRWAIAYKFEAPLGVTTVKAIDVQVGRTGRVTPVARVAPVEIGGSTVSNATLHNQDYIDILELSIGDTVAVSKRGDIIPAVEKVVLKNEEGNTVWKMPEDCPECGSRLSFVGAHMFCENSSCPAKVRGGIFFFTGKGQMDIENLGPETINVAMEAGLIRDMADIYSADFDALGDLSGFGEKKIALIKEGIGKSKTRPYERVLVSLGIPGLGEKAAELLIDAGYRDVDDLIRLAEKANTVEADAALEELTAIPGIGEKTAEIILRAFADPELLNRIGKLKKAGLNFRAEAGTSSPVGEPIFEGQTWCVTGSFEKFNPRSKAMDLVKRYGGKTVSQVSNSTTHLLAGTGGGSKLSKAGELDIKVVGEKDFLDMLARIGVDY